MNKLCVDIQWEVKSEPRVQNRFGFAVDLVVDAEEAGHLLCSEPSVVGLDCFGCDPDSVGRCAGTWIWSQQGVVAYFFSYL